MTPDEMRDEAEHMRQYIIDQRAMQLREWHAEDVEDQRREMRDVTAADEDAPRSNTLNGKPVP